MPRKVKTEKLTRTGKTNIRKFAGVGKTKDLVEAYKTTIPDVYKLFTKDELQRDAYKYFGDLYNTSLETAPIVITKSQTRYTGQLVFEVEVKGSGGFGKKGQGTARKFIRTTLDVPLLTMKQVKDLEKREIASLYEESDYLSVKSLRHKLQKTIIRKPVNSIMTAPIKEAGAIDLDGFIKNSEWCKNNGMCVPDWLVHKYLDCPRSKIKKKIKNADIIEYHSTHNLDGERVHNNNPNKDGYTIQNIILFCSNCNLPVYILHDGRLIFSDRNTAVNHTKNASPLVIEVKNGHLYPITKLAEIKRIVQIPVSNGVITKKETKDEGTKKGNPLPLVFDCEYSDPLEWYLKKQRELNTQQYPQKALISGGKLAPVKIGGALYVSAEKDKAVEAYANYRGKEYTGQTAPAFVSPFMTNMPTSYLNNEVMEALTTRGVKNRTHIGFYRDYELDEEEEETGFIDDDEEKSPLPPELLADLKESFDKTLIKSLDPICLDINKAYRDVMERPLDDFMTLDFNSLIEEATKYDKKKFGLWFVETDDLTLLHQSNWYSSKILAVAHKDGIKFKPKYFIAGKREGSVLLNMMIQEISDTNPNNDPSWVAQNQDISGDVNKLVKNMINSISGILGRTNKKTTRLNCDSDVERVWEDYFTKPKKWETDFVFRALDGDEENPPLYCWGRVQNQELLTNNLPMYIQILDWANIKLHQLIKSTGGYEHLLYRKTDFIMMEDVGQTLTPSNEVGGYKIEELPKHFVDMDDARAVEYTYIRRDTERDMTIITSDDYDKVIARLDAGKSLLLDSRAGTGKSYIINKVSEHYGETAVRRIAFTNKASNNIDGKTIHKFFGIDKNSKINLEQLRKRMSGVKVICIDEISMIGKDLWKHIYYVKKYFKDVVFLLCGEEAQLPPIEDDELECGYFHHPTIMLLCDYTYASLNLTDKCRYDRVLYDYLTNIKEEVPNAPRPVRDATLADFLEGTNLVFTNKRRLYINEIVNKYHANSFENTLKSVWEDDPDLPPEKYRQTTIIYDGLPLLVFAMDKINGLVKNTIHIVCDVNTNTGTFRLEDNDGEFIEADVNKKFIMCYAMTIHKSQGDTIDGQVNIHEYGLVSDNKQLYYTAVSRGRELEKIKYFN